MGFAPDAVDRMSIWQFQAAVAGWMKAHVPEDPGTASADELDAIWQSMREDGLVH